VAAVMVELSIFRGADCIHREMWKMESRYSGSESKKGMLNVKLDALKFEMPAGENRIVMKCTDLNDMTQKDSTSVTVVSKREHKTGPSISDIVLCDQIRRASNMDPALFVKDTLFVMPNPSLLYGENKKHLWYYTELYNMDTIKKGNKVTIEASITGQSSDKKDPAAFSRKEIVTSSDHVVHAGELPVLNLPSGNYRLNLNVSGPDGLVLAKQEKMFFIYNPNNTSDTQNMGSVDLNQDVFGLRYPLDVEKEIQYISYITTKTEQDIIKKLQNKAAKENYLASFWKRKDTNPSTPGNEFRDEYLDRIVYANANFGKMGNGWQTDFGRVYILHGKADDVKRYLSNATGRAYQIWRYDYLQGGVEFIFIDMSGFDQYQLVHSTMRGEIKNESWERLLEISNILK
jgi:GWxTD domain-containing protein